MREFSALVRRHCSVFFKDKSVFFPSLITPLILLFLFIAFLGNVYRDSIRSVAAGFEISDGLVESIAGGWLVSSLVAVCAVTVAFTANTVMVQDKVSGARNDFLVSPVSGRLLALSYFVSTYLVTAFMCFVALGAGFIYLGIAGWHLSAADVFLTVLDLLLMILFGTAFSFAVCSFLHSQGGIAAVQATVSSAYGFLCGAYMPLSNLAEWLKNLLMFLPGTYGTGLTHLHLMGGAMEAMRGEGIPAEVVQGMREGFDCTLTFFGSAVPVWVCYTVLAAAGAALLALCVLLYLRPLRKSLDKIDPIMYDRGRRNR